ncbi:MAG: DUF4105 domain-containing protein [Alphaproteobacteria bacterium]|nr:DUF4105 domain-containing protein [Alphaproteobacteria bacterium]
MPHRKPSPIIRAAAVIAVALSAIFASGVLWYHGPELALARGVLVLAWLAFATLCAVSFLRGAGARPLFAYALPFAALIVWFALIAPRNDRLWSPEMARTLTYARDGDTITLSNVRNFNWTGPAIADERWETRSFDLNKLKTVDVLSLYWKGPRVAHTYFSFVWTNGEALSLSVEIRKEKGEAYSPIAGFFKAYELSILAGDERDFYGWRVFFPKEDIQLFHTRTNPLQARKLLLELLDSANALAKTPVFYNTLTENCSTEVWMLTEALGLGQPNDMRVWASGYLPDFLYDLKVLNTAHTLADLRDKGHIMPRVRTALENKLEGPAFSNAIRNGVPAMPD